MPKKKYSRELKEQALADYEKTKDAKSVAAKYGVTPKEIWQWKATLKISHSLKMTYPFYELT